jgi:hypothetical protein
MEEDVRRREPARKRLILEPTIWMDRSGRSIQRGRFGGCSKGLDLRAFYQPIKAQEHGAGRDAAGRGMRGPAGPQQLTLMESSHPCTIAMRFHDYDSHLFGLEFLWLLSR